MAVARVVEAAKVAEAAKEEEAEKDPAAKAALENEVQVEKKESARPRQSSTRTRRYGGGRAGGESGSVEPQRWRYVACVFYVSYYITVVQFLAGGCALR